MGGIPFKALHRALKEDVYISDEIEAELSALKERLRKKLKPKHLEIWTNSFIPSILGRMHHALVQTHLSICRDPKDNAYLSLAKAVSADFLITGDKDLLAISQKILSKADLDHLSILSPR